MNALAETVPIPADFGNAKPVAEAVASDIRGSLPGARELCDQTRMRNLHVAVERFPIAGKFAISRGQKTEAVVVVAIDRGGGRARARRVRALCPLWRNGRDSSRADRIGQSRDRGRRRPRAPAKPPAAWRCAQRARLRALGSRRQEQRRCRPCARRTAGARRGDHRLHDFGGEPARDGGGGGAGELAARAENQTSGGRRPGADRRRPRRRAAGDAHRRRQRSLDGRRTPLLPRGLRRGGRRARRAAPAGGPRRGAGQNSNASFRFAPTKASTPGKASPNSPTATMPSI